MTGTLSWMAMYFLGKTVQQGELVEMLFMQESNWNVLSFA